MTQSILIVDDLPQNLVALRQTLSELDAELVEAHSGQEALAATMGRDLALAILDVQMPGMDGYELAELLEGDPQTAEIPVIFLTAQSPGREQINKGYRSGAVDYIIKPYEPQHLIAKVKVFLKLHAQKTELKRYADLVSDEAEARFRTITESSPDAIFITDAKGNYTYVNEQATLLLGYSFAELTQMNIADISPPDQRESSIQQFQQLLAKKRLFTELDLVHKDGSAVPVDLNAVVLPNGQVYGSCRDISERRKLQLVLQQEGETLRAVFDGIDDVIYVADPESYELLHCNEAFKKNWGENVVGKKCYRVLQDRDDPCPFCTNDKIFGEHLGKTFYWEFQNELNKKWYRCADKAIRWRDGRMVRFELAVDITETKAMQTQLTQADRMSSMGMLAAGVAHEINNPLCYILYNLESLTEDLPELLDAMRTYQAKVSDRFGVEAVEETTGEAAAKMNPAVLHDIQDRFRDALGGTRRIRDVARGLGTFSRVERDQLVPVNLMHVIDAALNMCLNEIKYRARMVKDYGKTPTVMASEGRLSQVFLNLFVNAAHAIDEGDVEGNEIRVRTWADDERVCAEVRDTGSGIAPENIGKLFEPFFTTKGVGAGSGLGLPISKGIVEGYGGTITVDSEVGNGTAFTVFLPVRAEEVAQAPVVDSGDEEVRVRGRILIVDDDDGIRFAMSRILCRHETIEAASGKAARELLEQDQQFDLILCDLMMPHVSGMELHEWLSEENPRLAKQLIFVTGGAFTPRARDYLKTVDNLRLEKPFDVATFKKIVGNMIREAMSQAE